GLLDTDGWVRRDGAVQFASSSQRLIADVQELIVSLGYRCQVVSKAVKGRFANTSTAYTITFSTPDMVFRLERKRLAHKERIGPSNLPGAGPGSSLTCVRSRAWRCAASRSTTRATSTLPA